MLTPPPTDLCGPTSKLVAGSQIRRRWCLATGHYEIQNWHFRYSVFINPATQTAQPSDTR